LGTVPPHLDNHQRKVIPPPNLTPGEENAKSPDGGEKVFYTEKKKGREKKRWGMAGKPSCFGIPTGARKEIGGGGGEPPLEIPPLPLSRGKREGKKEKVQKGKIQKIPQNMEEKRGRGNTTWNLSDANAGKEKKYREKCETDKSAFVVRIRKGGRGVQKPSQGGEKL